MGTIRRFLGIWVLAMVASHLGGMATVVAALAVEQAAAEDTLVCTCAQGGMADCPMHKAPAGAAARRSQAPAEPHCCRAQPLQSDMLLTSLIIWSGALVPARSDAHDRIDRKPVPAVHARPLYLARSPMTPPPKNARSQRQ